MFSFGFEFFDYYRAEIRARNYRAFQAFCLPALPLAKLFRMPLRHPVWRGVQRVLKLPCWKRGRWRSLT